MCGEGWGVRGAQDTWEMWRISSDSSASAGGIAKLLSLDISDILTSVPFRAKGS